MPAIIRIGRLRHRVELQRKTPQLDSLGRQSRAADNWTTTDKVWAEVLELSGKQAELAKQQAADASYSVTIRYRAGLDTTMRLLFRDRVLEIKAVLDSAGDQRQLVLLCGEERKPPR